MYLICIYFNCILEINYEIKFVMWQNRHTHTHIVVFLDLITLVCVVVFLIFWCVGLLSSNGMYMQSYLEITSWWLSEFWHKLRKICVFFVIIKLFTIMHCEFLWANFSSINKNCQEKLEQNEVIYWKWLCCSCTIWCL